MKSEIINSKLNLNLNDTIKNQNYTFDLKIEGFNDNKVIDSKRVLYLNTIYDFINNNHPLILLGVQLTRYEYYNLRKLYTNDKPILKSVYLNVKTSVRFSTDSTNDINNTVFKSLNNFTAIVDNISTISDSEFLNFNIADKENEEPSIRLTLGLFEKNTLQPFTGNILNGIYPNIDVNSLLYHGYSECIDGDIKFFANPSDNTNIYSQVLIEPVGFYDFLKFIDEEYGIYKYRYKYFFMNNIFYLYPVTGKLKMKSSDNNLNSFITINLIDKKEKDNASTTIENDIIEKYSDDNKIVLSLAKEKIQYDVNTYNPMYNYYFDIKGNTPSTKKISDTEFVSGVIVRNHKNKLEKVDRIDKYVTLSLTSRPDIPILPNTEITINNIDMSKTEKYRPVLLMQNITTNYCNTTITGVEFVE